ncbi:hypothetical protein ACJRO7_033455 [Eucalyptus globulus]|uniref:Uncharacterized protein n=1 Tax=Eucalyptus globulus TaxID=34317 RepID=A0ABD3JM56_EUCGL
MDKTGELIGLQSQEGLTAFEMNAIQELMQLKQQSNEGGCNSSGHGSNSLSWAVKGRSKGSNHQDQGKVLATEKKRTEAVLDRGESLPRQKKKKYRSIVEIYAETKPVDAVCDDH